MREGELTKVPAGVAVVTGSSGRVGDATAQAFDASGWRVRGGDRVPGRWTSVVGDLRDEQLRRAAVRAAEVVVHVAALHAPHVGRVDDAEFRSVNVEATAALLDAGEAAGVRRVVYISSTSVYGHALVPTDRAVWVDESLPPRPRDIYDETKLAAEQLVTASAINSTVLRIGGFLQTANNGVDISVDRDAYHPVENDEAPRCPRCDSEAPADYIESCAEWLQAWSSATGERIHGTPDSLPDTASSARDSPAARHGRWKVAPMIRLRQRPLLTGTKRPIRMRRVTRFATMRTSQQ